MTSNTTAQTDGATKAWHCPCEGVFGGDREGKRDRIEPFVWAALFLWAAAVLLAGHLGWIAQLESAAGSLPLAIDGWVVFFLGAALILLIEIAARLVWPANGKPGALTIGGAVVFLVFALGALPYFWPIALGAIGLSIAVAGLRKSRS